MFIRRNAFGILVWAIAGALWLQGCASVPVPTRSRHIGKGGILGSCADFFAAQDQEILGAKVLDPGAFRIDGFPYLRTDRFLASFKEEVYDPKAFAAWVDRLQAVDRQARHMEIANLSGLNTSQEQLEAVEQRVVDCGELLKTADVEDPKIRQQLRKHIAAPDEYIEVRRILGLYPITRWFVSRGVQKWQTEARREISLEPPADWQLTLTYSSPYVDSLPTSGHLLSKTARDALGIPEFTSDALNALFSIYAPVWEVETQSSDDYIGAPYWTQKNELNTDKETPVTYTLLSFSRFDSKVLAQLNYIIWFPARPKSSGLDIYGGRLDGINYRVTLDMDGTPLLYETIHNCGCYYKAFATQRLKIRSDIEYAEPPLILAAPFILPHTESMVVSLESHTHHVRHLYPRPRVMSSDKEYQLTSYQGLRSLPLPQSGRRSMFRQDGIAYGTQRLERFVLWPMGVNSPGAMRPWGRHAVALVGKRHFDDPFYLEKMFSKNQEVDHPVP